MKHQELRRRIKKIRASKGLSQEQLAEESKLSLRTIQRIENGESVPRGDTLLKLAKTLNTSPEELIMFEVSIDNGYVQLLNWSSLLFVIQPLLGVIVPMVMWVLKREKVKGVDESGKEIINFQITWSLTLYLFLIVATIVVDKKLSIPFNFSIKQSFFAFVYEFSLLTGVLFSFYLFNIALIFFNVRRSQKGLKNYYVVSIPFLK